MSEVKKEVRTTYKVASAIRYNGKLYRVGDNIALTDIEAEQLQYELTTTNKKEDNK